jgi:hypothetical protein
MDRSMIFLLLGQACPLPFQAMRTDDGSPSHRTIGFNTKSRASSMTTGFETWETSFYGISDFFKGSLTDNDHGLWLYPNCNLLQFANWKMAIYSRFIH